PMIRSFFAREEAQGFFGREAGQGLVEYALIIALVSIALIVALGIMSGALNGVFSTITTTLNEAGS
ncbi:MAG TPA: Flp family type IVb pilin, partial [Herpetosiphonaceae bacterium]|nr:Flp family type IVb pilin [Herpetosiphonaceae bacterium]